MGLQIAAALWAVAVVPLAVLLLVVARTWDGRVFAVAAVLTGILPALAVAGWAAGRRALRQGTVGLAAGGLIAGLWVVGRAPAGTAPDSCRVRHVYADGQSKIERFALGNLLPECDQLMLGFTVMPAFDALFTRTQAGELKRATAAIYAEMERDQDFRRLGSVMPEAYHELLGLPFERGHAYVYIPPRLDRTRPHPVVVFFHGSGGDFKAYLWIWSKIADRAGCMIVAPSYGLGNWRSTASECSLRQALASIARIAAVDRRQVYLAGLSNGGRAVSELAARDGSTIRAMIFVSPVFDAPAVQSKAFAIQCRDKDVLVVTGVEDDRVPLAYVRENAAAIGRFGARVRLEALPAADHFLFFRHREQVVDLVAAWLPTRRD